MRSIINYFNIFERINRYWNNIYRRDFTAIKIFWNTPRHLCTYGMVLLSRPTLNCLHHTGTIVKCSIVRVFFLLWRCLQGGSFRSIAKLGCAISLRYNKFRIVTLDLMNPIAALPSQYVVRTCLSRSSPTRMWGLKKWILKSWSLIVLGWVLLFV